MSGWTVPPDDLVLGDPAGVHIELLASQARIAIYGAAGQLLAELDGTDTFNGEPFVSLKIYDMSGNVIAQSDRFQVLSGNSTDGPYIRLVHGGFPGQTPRLESLPPAVAGSTIAIGSIKATSDAATHGAALVLESPALDGRTPARLTLAAVDDSSAAALATLEGQLAVTGPATVEGGLPVLAGVGVTGTVVISAATFGTVTIPFGVTFPAAPRVSATIVSGSGSAIRATVFVTAVTTTQCTVRVDLNAAATVNIPVHVIAVAQ